MKTLILIIFILTYLLMIVLPKYKLYITGISAITCIVMLLLNNTSISAILQSIDYNVLLMLLGIMLTVGLFSNSEMPNYIATKLIKRIPSTTLLLVVLTVIAGFVSAFIDNVATVLMLAPIGIAVAKKSNISPVPVIISIAVSSNLQGAATLVGDTTSIMLGGFVNMSFTDFIFMNGKPSIFWAVELGMLVTIPVLFFIFRKNKGKIQLDNQEVKIKSYIPTILLLLNIVLLIAFSFVENKPSITNGIICVSIGLVGLIFDFIKNKGERVKVKNIVDFSTILFLTCLFVIIYAVKEVGIIKDISLLFTRLGADNIFALYTIIVFGSVLASAFIDNIPYVATMLPVIQALIQSPTMSMVAPQLLYFGLLTGATLGGNLTPIGASANVVGISLLNKAGHKTKNSDFFKIGIPFTLMAVMASYIFIWLVWGI